MTRLVKLLENWLPFAASSDEAAIVRRIIAKQEARQELLDRPRLSHAFMRLDRVFSREPVNLFGHVVGSVAFNRLSLHAANADPATGDTVPGPCLFTGLIGEEMLSRLIMNRNRGESEACITGETLMGHDLGPWHGRMPDPEALFEAEISSEARRDRRAQARELNAMISNLRKPLGKRNADALSDKIRRLSHIRDFRFEAERFIENAEKQRISVQVEAAHTALNIGRIMRDPFDAQISGPASPEPGQPASRIDNPLLDVFSGKDPEEARIIASAARRAIAVWLDRLGLDQDTYDPAQDPHGKQLRHKIMAANANEKTAAAEWLCGLISQAENPHILQRERATSPWCMTASLTEVNGAVHGLHSDLMTRGSSSMRLSIATAVPETSFGEVKIRAGREIIELEMMPGDLMMLLRGHPSGDFMRCTLKRLCGAGLATQPYTNRIDRLLQSGATEPEGANPDPDDPGNHVREALMLIEDGLRNASQREAFCRLVERITDQVEQAENRNLFRRRADLHAAQSVIRDDFEAISDMLSRETGHKHIPKHDDSLDM